MTTRSGCVLIVARSGPVGRAVRALLRTFPQIDVIEQVTDVYLARQVVQEDRPSLVVLDALPGDAALSLAQWIKQTAPAMRCLLMVDTVAQQQAAQQTGAADAVLLEGAPATDLRATIARLLGPP